MGFICLQAMSPSLPSFNVEKQSELKKLYSYLFGTTDFGSGNSGLDVVVSLIDNHGLTLRLVKSDFHSIKLPHYEDKRVLFGSRAHTMEDVKSEIVKLFQRAWENH